MTLYDGLMWLLGAGAGVLAFYVIDRLETQTRWPWLAMWLTGLRPDDKRLVTFAAVGLIAVAAYLVMLVMLYAAPPGDWRGWIEDLFVVVAAAIIASQVAHGEVVLGRR